MSLINQMLRDLESRNTTNNTPSTLQHNIQVTRNPASKIPYLIWSLLAIITTGGTYWTYQYSKSLLKTPAVTTAENIRKEPMPGAPLEKVLDTPNAVTDTTQNTVNIVNQPVTPISPTPAVQPTPAAQTVPANRPEPPAQPIQPATTIQTEPEIVAEPPVKKMPMTSPKPTQIKQITAKQQADTLYRQAENNSDAYSNIYKLEQALLLDPRHLKARLLLAKTLHNQGQINKTAEFLDQSLSLFPDNLQFINTRAQLYLQQKNPSGALNTLQRIDVANNTNETYLSLLAATYQQQQSFFDAAKIYQRLTSVNPEKAENWLGFALSQDKLGNTKLAREAYQQALNKNPQQESIKNYIKQRLIDLR